MIKLNVKFSKRVKYWLPFQLLSYETNIVVRKSLSGPKERTNRACTVSLLRGVAGGVRVRSRTRAAHTLAAEVEHG